MPEVMQFDAEVSQQLEATYLTPDVVEQRRLQLAALDLKRRETCSILVRVRACWPHEPLRRSGERFGARDRPERADAGDRRAPE